MTDALKTDSRSQDGRPSAFGLAAGSPLVLSGDCLQVMATLEAGSVNAIITDLPYGTTACKWDSVIPFAPLWEQARRVLKPNGVFVTTASQPFTTTLIASNLAAFKYCWTWNKGKAGNFATAKIQPLRVTEDVVVFAFGRPTYNPQMTAALAENKRQRDRAYAAKEDTTHGIASGVFKVSEFHDEDTRYPTNLLNFKSTEGECNNLNRVHPTQKPLELMRYLVRTYTNPGDTILDPCCGSGTTGVAAQAEGRNCVLIEREEKYLEITRQRLLANAGDVARGGSNQSIP